MLHTLSCTPSDAYDGSAGSYSKSHTAAQSPGTYNGCETDTWMLAVVLFALATCSLPFDSLPLPIDAEAECAHRKWVLHVVGGAFWAVVHGMGMDWPQCSVMPFGHR